MKLAFIKQKYVPFGGGETYLAALMDACAARGHDIHLIACQWSNRQQFPFSLHRAKINKLTRGSRVRSFASSVSHIVGNERFDAVFSLERTVSQQIWRAGDCVYSKWLKRRALYENRFKNIFNSISPGQRAVVKAEKRCVHSTPFIIANSALVKEDLLETYGDLESEIHVIHNGYDPNSFFVSALEENRMKVRNKLALPPDKQVICFAASGWRRKGLLELMKALKHLPDTHLLVVGRDRAEPWMEIAKQEGVTKRVHFLGGWKEMRELYHASDVTVLPSWYDSFGFTGVESIASGIPYVTTTLAGSCEIIEAGVNGYVVSRPDSVDELVTALEEALKLTPGDSISSTAAHLTLNANIQKTLKVIEKC